MGKKLLRFKYDLKLIVREPIMILFAILPLFLMFLFRYGAPPLMDFIASKMSFEPSLYTNYVFTMALLMTPYMTGTLAGFLMLDEKDGNVMELILMTPRGFTGYLISRLTVPAVLSTVYLIVGFFIFSLAGYGFSLMPGIAAMIIIQSGVTALILFSAADNKVQGLTFAKGLGLLMLPIFFDLLNNTFLNVIGYISPYYWIYNYLINKNAASLLIGLIVNLIWLLTTIIVGFRKTYKFKTAIS